MRIVVIGAGGTGGYYGGLLARAGEDVTFLARGTHLEDLRTHGLTVRSRLTGTFSLPVQVTNNPQEIGPVDLVLFCLIPKDQKSCLSLALTRRHQQHSLCHFCLLSDICNL